MRYLYCDFIPQICLGGDGSPVLQAKFDSKLSAGTTPFAFYSGSHCYWRILPPNDFTDFVSVKIQFNKLDNTDCYIINGGTMLTATNETLCEEGGVYEFNYYGQNPDSEIFVVTVARYNDDARQFSAFATVEFNYWAESSFDYEKIVWYGVAFAAGFGTLVCFCAAAIFYS